MVMSTAGESDSMNLVPSSGHLVFMISGKTNVLQIFHLRSGASNGSYFIRLWGIK